MGQQLFTMAGRSAFFWMRISKTLYQWSGVVSKCRPELFYVLKNILLNREREDLKKTVGHPRFARSRGAAE
jgi:hypothetical protein